MADHNVSFWVAWNKSETNQSLGGYWIPFLNSGTSNRYSGKYFRFLVRVRIVLLLVNYDSRKIYADFDRDMTVHQGLIEFPI